VLVVKLSDFFKTFYTSLQTWTASVCISTPSTFGLPGCWQCSSHYRSWPL